MIVTNLVASIVVTLTTNVSDVFPKHMVEDPVGANPDGSIPAIFRVHYEDVKDPKEKWVVTKINEVTTFKFTYNGIPMETERVNELTNWTTHFTLAPPEPKKWVYNTNNPPIPLTWQMYWGKN